MGERLARRDIAVEGEEDRARGVAELAVGDLHGAHRLGLAGDPLPHAERLQEAPGAGGDGGGAHVVRSRGPAEGRVGDEDAGVRTEAVAQGQRQRQPGEAAAGDRHILPL